jgi:hypothetical protein
MQPWYYHKSPSWRRTETMAEMSSRTPDSWGVPLTELFEHKLVRMKIARRRLVMELAG